MDHRFGPLEGSGLLVVSRNETINGVAQLTCGCETRTSQRRPAQDTEPAFHLIQPRTVCRYEVEVHVGMQFEPTVPLWLVRVEIVENHVHFSSRILRDDFVHDVQKLALPASGIMPGLHLPGGNIQSRE